MYIKLYILNTFTAFLKMQINTTLKYVKKRLYTLIDRFHVAQNVLFEEPMHIEKKKTDSTLIHSNLYIKQSQIQVKFTQQNILYTSSKKCHQIYSVVAEMKHVKAVQTT
jgi:hypothetical protein